MGGTSLKFSIVIANYNYGHFVSRAIESALAVDWPNVEVVVIDDGSTDNSREVIESYRDRISAIFQENAGQRSANNVAYAATTGDLIIFLDADDVLAPELAQEVAAVWRPGVSKVQVLMRHVDENEHPLGSVIPRLTGPPSPEQIRRWATTMLEYPSPPGSGNIYSRTFLNKLFPIDESRDTSTDSTCIAMAPFLGDVITIARPMVLYRIHGGNDSNLLADDANFGREVERAVKRLQAAQDACVMQGLPPPSQNDLRHGPHLLQLRIASLRLRPADHPLPGDNRVAAAVDALCMPFRGGFEPLSRRLAMSSYCLLVLMLPLSLARIAIRKRF
jgi:glycosyltransferase involved in cell wall biosynthesis